MENTSAIHFELASENLRAENERLRKALEWYADYATWEQASHADQGDRARIALNSAKGQDGAVVVVPAGDSPLRELYESPEFRAAWANREEK